MDELWPQFDPRLERLARDRMPIEEWRARHLGQWGPEEPSFDPSPFLDVRREDGTYLGAWTLAVPSVGRQAMRLAYMDPVPSIHHGGTVLSLTLPLRWHTQVRRGLLGPRYGSVYREERLAVVFPAKHYMFFSQMTGIKRLPLAADPLRTGLQEYVQELQECVQGH